MSLDVILEKAKYADSVVIVGAGRRGKDLLEYLENKNILVNAFFDNDEVIRNSYFHGILITKPRKIDGFKTLYIVAIDSVGDRKRIILQLKELGISERDIVPYDCFIKFNYLNSLPIEAYAEEINKEYYKVFGKVINWNHPVTYNEKINCDKLNIQDSLRTRLADKLLVREWIREKIGDRYLTKLYGVWNSADDINFCSLPNSFALKMNNASGRNIIVKDKSKIDWDMVRNQFGQWKRLNYAYVSFELQYKDIEPKIICEEYLEGVAETIYDYNVYCFHGEPEYIWCIKGSHKPECKASFYNKRWEMQPFSYGYPKDEDIAPQPGKLGEMLELSRILSKDFKHVRVDWYNLPDGRLLFGEMTFTTWGGLRRFQPDEYDMRWGNLI